MKPGAGGAPWGAEEPHGADSSSGLSSVLRMLHRAFHRPENPATAMPFEEKKLKTKLSYKNNQALSLSLKMYVLCQSRAAL